MKNNQIWGSWRIKSLAKIEILKNVIKELKLKNFRNSYFFTLFLTPWSPDRGRDRGTPSWGSTQSRECFIAGSLPGCALHHFEALGLGLVLVWAVMVMLLGRVLHVVSHPVVGIVHEVLCHWNQMLDAAADLILIASGNLVTKNQ